MREAAVLALRAVISGIVAGGFWLWSARAIPGGFKAVDTTGQALAYIYPRAAKAQADAAERNEALRMSIGDIAAVEM